MGDEDQGQATAEAAVSMLPRKLAHGGCPTPHKITQHPRSSGFLRRYSKSDDASQYADPVVYTGVAHHVFPPDILALILWFKAMTLLVFFACTGWAWGCAATRAAYAARNKALVARTIQQLEK